MKRYILFFLFLLSLKSMLLAQEHSWANKLRVTSTFGASIAAQTTDEDGNVYIGGNFRDSIFIGPDTHVFTGTNSTGLFFAKLNADGEFIWSKAIVNIANATLLDMKTNSKGKIIIYGHYITNSTLTSVTFGTFSLTRNRGVFATFMDTAGTFTDAVDLAYAGTTANAWRIAIGPNDELFTYNYLNGFSGGYTINSTSGAVTGSTFIYAICKHDSTGKILRWSNIISLSDLVESGDLTVDNQGDVYYGYRASSGRTINGIASGIGTPMYLFKVNGTTGAAISTIRTTSTNSVQLQRMESVGKSIFIQGYAYKDSINLLGKVFKVQGNSVANRPFYFLARLNSLDSVYWCQTSNNLVGSFAGSSNLTLSSGFLYSSYVTNTDSFKMGGLAVYNTPAIVSTVCKFDTLGNALWILKNPSTTACIVKPIGRGDLVYSGAFRSNAVFSPFTLTKTGNAPWPFLARTTDFRIFRGQVRKGPYCAGDSLNIPYTKEGAYDTSNTFIAEISDENGQFIGRERILGQIKARNDSVIKGALPLLQVPTSELYRIRIRSTAPAVASFFKEDTLKLLIYSRDKANPGNDTSICVGDTFMLNTFGGTAWKWSPFVNMENSNLRTPRIWPDTATTYQIIISDSSGCGAPDTAKIKISLKPLPKIKTSSISDSTACLGQTIKINASFEGGIEVYTAIWLNEINQPLQKRKTLKNDSFQFVFKTDTLIKLILTDSCATINDTMVFLVKAKPLLQKLSITKDTLICMGKSMSFDYNFLHQVLDSVRISWRSSQENFVSNSFTFIKTISQTDTLFATITNSCNAQVLKDSVITTARSPLSTAINGNQSFYCRGSSIALNATANGGKSVYFHQWTINGTLLSDSSRFVTKVNDLALLYPGKDSLLLKLKTTDSCTVLDANDSIWLKIKPALIFDVTQSFDSILCKSANYQLAFPVLGGFGKYQFHWQLGNINSTDSAWQFKVNNLPSGNYPLMGIVKDNCSTPDTFFKTVFIADSLATNINPNKDSIALCIGENQTLKSSPNGGNTMGYTLSWVTNGTGINADSLVLKAFKKNVYQDSGYWVQARLADGCSFYEAIDSIYINIKKYPVASLNRVNNIGNQVFDTTLCFGEKWTIQPMNYFGSAAANSFQWILNGAVIGNSNSLLFDTSVFKSDDATISLFYAFNDNCSDKADTLKVNITILKALALEKLTDTTLCFGSNLNTNILVSGGKAAQYAYQWKNLNNNSIVSSSSSLALLAVKKPMVIERLVSDNCSSPNAKDTFSILILDSLSIQTNPKDSCVASNVTILAQGNGGLSNNYSYSWFVNNQLLAITNATLNLSNIDSSLNYKVVLKDNCSQPSDTIFGKISPNPIFNFAPIKDTACAPLFSNLIYEAINKDDLNYSLYINNSLQTNSTAIALSSGLYNLKLVSKNNLGCKDSFEQTILVKPRPTAGFSFNPQNPNDDSPRVSFKADNTTYNSYQWKLNSELISQSPAFEYLFKDSGTYTITLRTTLDICSADSTQLLNFQRSYSFYNVNSFTPNGDGINDVFKPSFTGISEMYYKVFNRWGEKVFDSNEHGLVWDGTYQNKPALEGQYIILYFVKDANRTQYNLKETILLLR